MAVRAPNEPSAEFHNHGEDPTRAFSWLKVHISTFTFKTLTRLLLAVSRHEIAQKS